MPFTLGQHASGRCRSRRQGSAICSASAMIGQGAASWSSPVLLRAVPCMRRAPGGAAHRYSLPYLRHPPSCQVAAAFRLGLINFPIDARSCSSSSSWRAEAVDAAARPEQGCVSASCTQEMRWAMMIFVVFGISSRRALRIARVRRGIHGARGIVQDQNFRLLSAGRGQCTGAASARRRHCVPPCSM